MDVDVVVTWVNGNDPAHRKKRRRFMAQTEGEAAPEAVATKTRRFSDNDEIRFCLRSIRNHAPWVRKIWLVTDNQFPPSIDRKLAEAENIRVVDHTEIFRGFEHLLPTFNSLAIETMLWRISGLADHFLYLNDDVMFVGPVTRESFFKAPGKLLLRGGWTDWSDMPDAEISFHGSNKLRGAEMMGYSPAHFFSTAHVCRPLWKPAMQALFERYGAEFAANAAFRFRDRRQFWAMSLHDHLLLREGRAEVMKASDALHFSVKLCKTAPADDLAARLGKLQNKRITMTCVNYLEAIVAKVPEAMDVIGKAAGKPARFEREALDEFARACRLKLAEPRRLLPGEEVPVRRPAL